MNYRSLDNLSQTLRDRVSDLPADLRLIVGVPRSGLLAANLLALHLNLPLTDPAGLLEGRLLQGGDRCNLDSLPATPGSILILDDSICTGAAMTRLREQLAHFQSPHRLIFAAVYAAPDKSDLVDFHFDTVATPRAFEWNILHSAQLAHACVDIDGVLCRDPSDRENDDGPRYLDFISTVAPRLEPAHEIAALVTSRLEKYRKPTEDWLSRHGIRYRQLLMLDLPDAATRRATRAAAPFKAQAYQQTGASLFIESSRPQALAIARLTTRPVYCTDTREMIQPAMIPAAHSALRRWIGDQHWRCRLAAQRLFQPHPQASPARGSST